MKTTKNNFLPIEEHPEEITVESYWKAGNGIMYLREALPKDHKENLWNWFKKALERVSIHIGFFIRKKALTGG